MCFLFAFMRMAEDEAAALKRQVADCMAEDALTPRNMSENYSPPLVPNYPPQNRRLRAAPELVVQATMLQMLTPQQALEAAACGNAVVRAECMSGVVGTASGRRR